MAVVVMNVTPWFFSIYFPAKLHALAGYLQLLNESFCYHDILVSIYSNRKQKGNLFL